MQQSVLIDSTANTSKRKYTLNASRRNGNATSTNSPAPVVAVLEGRGFDKLTIGVACIDLRTMEIDLFQFVDTSSYMLLKSTLHIIDPIDIISADHKNDKHASSKHLNLQLSKMCDCELHLIPRRHFHETLGIEFIKQYVTSEASNIDSNVLKKCCELGDIRIILEGKNETNQLKNSTANIISFVELLSDVDEINDRLDAVEELMGNKVLLKKIRGLLSEVQNLQQLITICIYWNADRETSISEVRRTIRSKITQILSLSTLLQSIFSLKDCLRTMNSPLIQKNLKKFADARLKEINKLIGEKFNDQVTKRRQRGSLGAKDAILDAVRDTQHVQLDLARRAYNELLLQISELSKQEGFLERGAVMAYTYGRGYHYLFKSGSSKLLPKECRNVVRNITTTTFTTDNLIKYNDRLEQLEGDILDKSGMIVNQLLNSIRPNIAALHNAVDFVSLLDFLCSITNYSLTLDCAVRPRFSKIHTVIKAGIHPLLNADVVVPNDTLLYDESYFGLITGPNMAGKSTYLKQVCLLQILAQTGCFVPAETATFVPRKQIIARISHNDELGDNLSSFAVEMHEMSIMLQYASKHSLIIIDELARSTAAEEGIAISYALCEKLIETKAFVLIATHYLDLCLLESQYPVVQNFHFGVDFKTDAEGKEYLVPSHILQCEPYKGPLYGLELTEFTSFPKQIIKNATEMATRFRNDTEKRRIEGAKGELCRRRQLFQLGSQIVRLADSRATEANLAECLNSLQKKFASLRPNVEYSFFEPSL